MIIHGKAMFARVYNVEVIQAQIFLGYVHRFGNINVFAELKFNSQPLSFVEKKKVQFCSGMGCPKVGVPITCLGEDLLHGKAFPGCPQFWVGLEAFRVGYAQESMQDTGVPNEYFG